MLFSGSGSGPPPSLIPTLWDIGILLHKQANLRKYMQHSVTVQPVTAAMIHTVLE